MDTVKNIWRELWNNKPLLITVIMALLILAYLFWRNIMVPAPTDTTAPGILPDGTLPAGDVGPPITVPGAPPPPPPPPVTIPSLPVPAPTNSPTPPTGVFVAHGPLVAPPSGKPQPPPARTATVTPWPTQTSTLWGIAQKYYGNGALWPKIYQANKAKIGSNPNLIHSGLVLVIP